MNGHANGAPWAELVSAALMGTDRRPEATPVSVLEQAAAQVVARRAGLSTLPAKPLAEAPRETAPLVPRAACDRLGRILSGEHPRLIGEWLALAAASGGRVPPRLIPTLLDLGARDRSIRAHLAVLAGARGRWLAGLNSGWGYLLAETSGSEIDHSVWEFGTRGDRLAFLAALRARAPRDARELLAVGWEQEGPDDRAAFVAVLADGLGMDDEPFLEAALDDRRREVRQAAADLLTRLPRSRLASRMAERAARFLVRAEGGLVAVPPTACDSTMERDGVRARPPAGTGQRSWWLQQVVAHTPLSFWTEHFGLPPEGVLALKIGDWSREVRMGWTRAAILQRDPGWARALFDVEPLTDLLVVLPAEEQSRRAADLVRTQPVDGQLIMMLGGTPGPWGGPLATAVLERIVETSTRQPWNAGELAKLAGERLDPAMHDHVARLADIHELADVTAVLRFRSDMKKELT